MTDKIVVIAPTAGRCRETGATYVHGNESSSWVAGNWVKALSVWWKEGRARPPILEMDLYLNENAIARLFAAVSFQLWLDH